MTTHFQNSHPSEPQSSLTLRGGTVLQPDGTLAGSDLHIDSGKVSTAPAVNGLEIDVSGCLVLPGIVDAHGDGFEHHVMPRVGTAFPLDIALRNVDRELVANGITTAYLAQSYSWEGGVRGIDAARDLINAVRNLAPAPSCSMRVQIRYETFFLDGADQLVAWLEDGTVPYVVFNNHVPEYQDLIDRPEHIARWAASVGLTADAFRALLEKTVSEGVGVLDAVARLAETMSRLGVPFGSHDDPDPETRRSYNALGGKIAEFPVSLEAAQAARELGNPIIMGAPNALRGKSASGNVSAQELITASLCDVLVSDYYYPALLHAPFTLVEREILDLSAAWALVSSGPADALGLSDRGRLQSGARGDVVVIQQNATQRPTVMATFVAGKPVFVDEAFAAQNRHSLFAEAVN